VTARPAAAAAFLGGFLLFTVQMVAGRLLLPWFGGGPAVWTACLLFFQVALLAGYALAHWARPWPWAGLVLLPLLASMDRWRSATTDHPTAQILLLLLTNVGGPYLMLAAGSPALQRRLADYGLYAWSNVGSVAGVVAYLALAEPLVRLQWQLWIWCGLYAAWVFAYRAATSGRPDCPAPVARPPVGASLRWLALSASGAALLAAATNQLSQEVFVTPLLWVLPLVLYLATFAMAFRNGGWYNRRAWALVAAVAGSVACVAAAMGTNAPLWLHLAAYPAALFACCRCVHGELAASRPDPSSLTGFYLLVAGGGAVGTALVAVAAPVALSNYDELFLSIAACCLLTSWRNWSMLAGAAVAIAAMAPGAKEDLVEAKRGFFGVVRTVNSTEASGRVRKLIHGRVMHGFQYADDVRRNWPTAYYARRTAIGRLLDRGAEGGRRVGVVGLGVGTLAAYGRAGDTFRFYEINPQVVAMARAHFSFLRESAANVEVMVGDARVVLDREPPQGFDLLAIDAFSSDAIPSHLLTREAFAIYGRHLKPGGAIAFHISNRYVDLAPVVLGLDASALRVATAADPAFGASEATWMVAGPTGLEALATPVASPPRVWTDDFSSVFSIWKLRGD
jgi:SAM-dependent methyltransferase